MKIRKNFGWQENRLYDIVKASKYFLQTLVHYSNSWI